VFDDTIEHEAWNDSDQVRTILICDIWNPRLAEEERDMVAAVMAAMDAFSGGARIPACERADLSEQSSLQRIGQCWRADFPRAAALAPTWCAPAGSRAGAPAAWRGAAGCGRLDAAEKALREALRLDPA